MSAIKYYDAGYTALVSVVPPGAKVSEHSKINAKDAGKVPGLVGYDGLYRGYKWHDSAPNRENVEQWKHEGSSVGFLSSAYPAIDIDILNEDITTAIVKAVEDVVGQPCLVRTGRHPKKLIVFRCDEPLRSFDMHYEKWSELLGAKDLQLIQFLGNGRQYVMDGIHPVTMKPYTIHDPGFALTLGPASLPTLTVDNVPRIFDAINAVMALFGYDARGSAAARLSNHDANQDDLKAPSLDELVELVSRIPNAVPDREDYVAIGYAIKAASQDFPEQGYDLFYDWCQRWEQGYNDPDLVARDWEKMVPPYRSGYDYLMDRAKGMGVVVSDLQFGPAEIGEAPQPGDFGATPESGPTPEVAASQQAVAAAEEPGAFTDMWLAGRFTRLHGKKLMAPVGMANTVYVWSGDSWVEEDMAELSDRVARFMTQQVSIAQFQIENQTKLDGVINKLGSYRTLQAVSAMVAKAVRVKMDQLDANPDLLNTPHGPIDLKTGQPLKPSPDMLLTKTTGVAMDPMGHCPLWRRFIDESCGGDAELKYWLQCFAGYCLTGHAKEQIFPFFIGSGGNGKSVFLTLLAELMGTYAAHMGVELLQAGRQSSDAPYFLAKLQGARMVNTSETKGGSKWDEQRLKQITGEDEITARLPYGQPFTFNTNCTLLVVGNHYPDMESVSEAIARRIKVVPWDYKPENPDKDLKEKLRKELPGILAWCVQGAMAWYQHGLPECRAIEVDTQEYLEEQDPLRDWVEQCLVPVRDPEAFVPYRDLHDSYTQWCRQRGLVPVSQDRMRKELVSLYKSDKVVRKSRTSQYRGFRNLKVVTPEGAAPANVHYLPAVAPPEPQG